MHDLVGLLRAALPHLHTRPQGLLQAQPPGAAGRGRAPWQSCTRGTPPRRRRGRACPARRSSARAGTGPALRSRHQRSANLPLTRPPSFRPGGTCRSARGALLPAGWPRAGAASNGPATAACRPRPTLVDVHRYPQRPSAGHRACLPGVVGRARPVPRLVNNSRRCCERPQRAPLLPAGQPLLPRLRAGWGKPTAAGLGARGMLGCVHRVNPKPGLPGACAWMFLMASLMAAQTCGAAPPAARLCSRSVLFQLAPSAAQLRKQGAMSKSAAGSTTAAGKISDPQVKGNKVAPLAVIRAMQAPACRQLASGLAWRPPAASSRTGPQHGMPALQG